MSEASRGIGRGGDRGTPRGAPALVRPALRVVGMLPASLVLVAEGAWVFVAYALFQAASRGPQALDPVAFVAAAACGAVAGRVGPRRVGGAWPAVAVALVALLAVLGWLTSEGTRGALSSGALADAVRSDPGGWLLGLAFVRGIPASRARGDEPAGPLVVVGIAAIVVSFIVAGALPEAAAADFRAGALPATVLFVGADLVGLALGRVVRLEKAPGVDWRRNPAWLGLLVAVAGALLVLAVPASFAIGPLVVLVLAALPIPLLFLGFLSGFDRRALRTLVTTIGTVVFVIVVLRVFASGPTRQGQQPPAAVVGQPPASDQAWMTVAGWVILTALLAVAIAILAAVWMRRAGAAPDDDVVEERSIDRGSTAERPIWRAPWRRPRRRLSPTDAVTAYLAAVGVLARHPELARDPAETPAEHAARVRRAVARPGMPRTVQLIPGPLARLAVDYELATFAERTLPAHEERRALERWEAIREASAGYRRRRPRGRGPAI